MRVCALIGDIKKSKQIRNWKRVFRKLEEVLDRVNEDFKDCIYIEFKPTVGDEFQGVLKEAAFLYDIYLYIKNNLPVEFYCGVGIGKVERPHNKDLGMRGDAFYRAREALQFCKAKDRRVYLKSEKLELDDLVNVILHFIQKIEESWTKRQRKVISLYRFNPSCSYGEIGERLRISKQAVSQILKAGNWDLLKEGEDVLRKVLRDAYS